MRRSLIVFVGGGVGACLRALWLSWLAPWGGAFPLPVLLANVLGAFVLAVIWVLADEMGLLGAETRLFLAVGVLGGFTTFSTFDWQADQLLTHGEITTALAYLATSVIGGAAAVIAGMLSARQVVAALERAAVGLLARLDERGARRTGVAREDIEAIEAEDREEAVR
jgi:CrcB protein